MMNRRRFQFSLRGLLWLTTAACVVVGVPGFLLVIYAVVQPLLIAALLFGVLLLLQVPLYLLVLRRVTAQQSELEHDREQVR